MSTARRIAVNVARTWVHLYTSRVPTELRLTRRAEIHSDLWDHEKDAEEDGVPPLVTALEIFLRTCLGVVDDLSWCFEARQLGRVASLKGRRSMMEFSARQTRWLFRHASHVPQLVADRRSTYALDHVYADPSFVVLAAIRLGITPGRSGCFDESARVIRDPHARRRQCRNLFNPRGWPSFS